LFLASQIPDHSLRGQGTTRIPLIRSRPRQLRPRLRRIIIRSAEQKLREDPDVHLVIAAGPSAGIVLSDTANDLVKMVDEGDGGTVLTTGTGWRDHRPEELSGQGVGYDCQHQFTRLWKLSENKPLQSQLQQNPYQAVLAHYSAQQHIDLYPMLSSSTMQFTGPVVPERAPDCGF
jgi:hypothetical protein